MLDAGEGGGDAAANGGIVGVGESACFEEVLGSEIGVSGADGAGEDSGAWEALVGEVGAEFGAGAEVVLAAGGALGLEDDGAAVFEGDTGDAGDADPVEAGGGDGGAELAGAERFEDRGDVGGGRGAEDGAINDGVGPVGVLGADGFGGEEEVMGAGMARVGRGGKPGQAGATRARGGDDREMRFPAE
ncbi:MAG: hypothetical protein R3F14_24330 [Polyangiaceae bacterium]